MKLQVPDFKSQDKKLRAMNIQHQKLNPLLDQAKKFLERRRSKNG
jgi:hypothetical protein